MTDDQPTREIGIAKQRPPDWTEVGTNLFTQVWDEYVEPELTRRAQAGQQPDESLYRWQVLLPWGKTAMVRLNREVGGTVAATAARPIEAGEDIAVEDIASVNAYTPCEEDAEVPHVTAFLHRDGWSLAFEFGYRDPRRHEHLQAGLEFLVTAHEAHAAGRLRSFADNAFSAVELLAKAELLSCAPTIEPALVARRHGSVAGPYNLWAKLGNTDPRYAALLNQLGHMRSGARYLNGGFALKNAEAALMLPVLDEMAEHVRTAVEDVLSERSYQVIAARPMRAGALVKPGDFTLKPQNH